MVKLNSLLFLAGVLAILNISGCFNSNPEDIMAFAKPHQQQVVLDNYVLNPPDELEIICTKVPEIHQAKQRIRPDGKISFEALGEFDVAGKTIAEAAAMIKNKAMTLYALAGDYPVDVRVSKFASKYYYIEGQVAFPGPRVLTGRDTVVNALSAAQPTVLAWRQKIQVLRPSADPEKQKPMIFEVNIEDIVMKGDVSKNVLLQEGDIVYVPPTVLAAIAMKIEEFVRPIGRAFSTVNVVQGPN